ncbi:MAG: sugar phosphate nucleotidyltransferase, partial [Pseudobdellovibrionaceae bacterium]
VVTFGIKTQYPETGYGYIQMSPLPLKQEGEKNAHSVVRFHEKPDLERAKKFVSSNFYCWNAGIFIFKVSTMIQAFKKHSPEIWNCFASLDQALVQKLHSDPQLLSDIYSKVMNKSIDYAILEKLGPSELCCVPADIGWSDVGSWDSYFQVNENKTATIIELGSSNSNVFGVKEKTYALVDVDDLMIVDTPDAMVAIKKGSSQKIKDVVEILKENKSSLVSEHPFEYRPWGYFEILKNTADFKSKVIQVLPGAQISYQSHSQRAEHWIMTRGQG